MQRFGEFLDIVRRRWPGNHTIRVASCRMEYQASLEMNITEDEIISGTLCWLENCVPKDTSDYYALAPHNFLREQSFLAYQPVKERLTVVQ